ncbi:hypothetical protein JCM3766R1_001690 [Sporobolomyces carnicolor]
MLSSLPAELLAQIIESAVPHTFHSQTYPERQATLRALSLVCSRFRAIAQPLLNDIAWFPSIKNLKLAAANERLRCTVVIFGNLKYKWFEDAIQFDLRYLQIRDIYCVVPDNLVLPHIESLCLGGFNYRSTTFGGLLTPTTLPALRHFALGDNAAASSVLTRIEGILPQLETITLDLDVWSALTPECRKLAVGRALVDCGIELFAWAYHARIPVAHLRMYDIIDLGKDTLETLVNLLTSRPVLELQSICLDCSLLTISNAEPGIERLREVCAQRKIEIVFERMPADYLVDSPISPEFVRRRKMAIRGDLSKRGGTHTA